MKYEPHICRWMRTMWVFVMLLATSSIVQATTPYKVLHNFGSGQDGSGPLASLTIDVKGNLFGTTANGGSNGDGAVFELTYSPVEGWSETLLHSFAYQVDGENPDGALAFDSFGNLYGTTPFRGPQLTGTVFELAAEDNGWNFSLLYDIGSHAGVVLDSNGDVYGPIGAGDYRAGAIGELSPGPDGWTYSALYSFCAHPPQCPDGDVPSAPLAWDNAGNLYGTTSVGGLQPPKCGQPLGCGVAFQLTPKEDGTWTYHLVHSFGGLTDDGQTPSGGLIVDRAGGLYGATSYGGPNFLNGTVFKLTPSSIGGAWKEAILYTFPDCSQGCGPYAAMAMDKAGNLYGTANGGNTSCDGFSCGVVFRLSPQPNGTWKYSVVHKFNGVDGFGPNGVIVGGDGNLYGTTIAGGQFNLGVAFEITP